MVCIAYPGAVGFLICGALILLGNIELIGLRGHVFSSDADTLGFYSRLGPPTLLFWGSIIAREFVLLLVAWHQMFRLWTNREIRI